MLDFLKKKKKRTSVAPLSVDIHSHLLPGIDDGAKSLEESLELLTHFRDLGYRKVITTPHIMSDFYQNTPAIIRQKLEELQEAARQQQLDIEINAAAEYYLDEQFYALLDKPEQLLTFGKNYILFETGFINQPVILFDAIFKMQSQGLKPIFAHPERYSYIQGNYQMARDIAERGALLQLNLNSLSGYYSPMAKKTAEKLIDDGLISFVGSDMHNIRHMESLSDSINKKYFDKLLTLDLLNNSLLDS
ncbi:tyrosine-protein phosphatase [Nafulsella turpanensis]|uniref:tyrosine-protein phosphatase n=1 Tax=Nafulsella turpanensis TaxID=1265690 RepID=UPI00034A8B67|nr:CpsB/CapC family capsule biosynthesis tyrosine phosphatase [Nafulsella turpanensis]